MEFLIEILAIFFTLNMGGASFGAAFAPSYGGRLIARGKARLLFLLFVVLGAVLYGHNVTITLGEDLVSPAAVGLRALMVIFTSAGLSLFTANLMKVPQTTSLVTVAAIAGVGLYLGNLNTATILHMLPFWLGLPVVSFGLTYGLGGYLYPPRKTNFWVYEKLVNHKSRLRFFVILCSCYAAFSVGSNNVPNVVGPLMALADFDIYQGLMVFAVFYGAGAFLFSGPLKTAGEQVVPLGLMSASMISLISGTLMIIASGAGIPQSFVMLQMGALFGIAALKKGKRVTFSDQVARRTLLTWTVNPLLTLLVSYVLARFLLNP